MILDKALSNVDSKINGQTCTIFCRSNLNKVVAIAVLHTLEETADGEGVLVMIWERAMEVDEARNYQKREMKVV